MATLEEIQLKVDEVKSKIPGIRTGIEALSASDLSEGASAVGVPDIGDQDTTAEVVSKGADSTAGAAIGVVDATEQRLKDEAAARQTAIDEAAKTEKSWLTKLTTAGKTTETKLAEEEEEAGVAGLSEEAKTQKLKVAGIQGDLAKLESRYLVDVDREGDRLASSGAIGLAENKITREYKRDKAYLSADLYAEAAVLSVYSDNLTEAKNSAQSAVNAYMYDQEQEVKRFEYLYDYHSDFLDSLKAEDKAIVDEAKATAEAEKVKVEAEKTNVMNMMLQYPKAGIKLTDTVEEATVKASAWSGTQIETWATGTPTSYKEWQLAGSPGTFEEWKKGVTTGTTGQAVFSDDSGTQYDLGTTEGLNQFKKANPDYTYEDMNAFLDQNVKGLDASTRKGLLEGSDFKVETRLDKQGVIDWAKEQRDKGYSDTEIKTSLEEKYPKDWAKEAVDRLEYTLFEKLTGWLPWVTKY